MVESKTTWSPEMSELFGNLFLLEKHMERLMDQVLLTYGLTSRQWFVLATIAKSANGAPSIQEVAGILNTSHQNIKAIALNLEKCGFLRLEKDAGDKRVTRLVPTEMNQEFWSDREEEGQRLITRIFGWLNNNSLDELNETVKRLIDNCQTKEGKES